MGKRSVSCGQEDLRYPLRRCLCRQHTRGCCFGCARYVLCNLYQYYIETVARDPRYTEQNFKSCVKFYKEVYREIKDRIEDKILAEYYSEVMRNSSMGGKMYGIIPIIGIREWLDKLEAEC